MLVAHPAVATRFFSFDMVGKYHHDLDIFTPGIVYASLLFFLLEVRYNINLITNREGKFAFYTKNYYLSSLFTPC